MTLPNGVLSEKEVQLNDKSYFLLQEKDNAILVRVIDRGMTWYYIFSSQTKELVAMFRRKSQIKYARVIMEIYTN